jgi:hypothetical protein
VEKILHFQSTVSVFLTYLILKAAPLVAVVYYFSTWQWALLSAFILLLIILIHSAYNNHNFSINDDSLTISPSMPFGQKTHCFEFSSIKSIEIKYAQEKDQQQWLRIHFKKTKKLLHFPCNWLHMQDPPDEDDHEHPEHELFELLEDEDFYDGSLQQLSHELRNRGVQVQEI